MEEAATAIQLMLLQSKVWLCLLVFFVHKQLLRLIFENNKELTCKDRIVYENIEYSHINNSSLKFEYMATRP